MKKRLEEETEPKVRELLSKDLAFLDRIQIQTASAREFLLILRFYESAADNMDVAAKEDIKRIFAVYYVQNLTQVYFDDYDGEHWVKGDELY